MQLIASPRFEEHNTPPGHPERPERGAVFDAIVRDWRDRVSSVVEPRAATRGELVLVHSAEHVRMISETNGRASMLDADTFTSPESYEIALLAAGAAGPGVGAAVRPPGRAVARVG